MRSRGQPQHPHGNQHGNGHKLAILGGNLEIMRIEYNPDGSDVDGEFVALRNIGATTNL